MKTSVIFGVVQMTFGIVMKAFNSLYFGRLVDFFWEFIPQIVLLWVLFGFMDLLIFVKWLIPWQVPCQQTGSRFDSSQAPSIITIIIAMFLKGGAVQDGETWLIGSDTSDGKIQSTLSIILVLIWLICIPAMLLVKPLYMLCTMKKHDEHHDVGRDSKVSHDESLEESINRETTGLKTNKGKAENIDLDQIL